MLELLLTRLWIDVRTAAALGVGQLRRQAAKLDTATTQLADRIAAAGSLTVDREARVLRADRPRPCRRSYKHCQHAMSRSAIADNAQEGCGPLWRSANPRGAAIELGLAS